MSFARDAATHAYYAARAAEYDDWYLGTGLFAARERPGWHEEVTQLTELVTALPPARTLDVACGTGFLTRHLQGEVVGLDQSEEMAAITRSRLPQGTAQTGDALALPFEDERFDRVFTAHFYGHLDEGERSAFLAEARRVAPELIVVDSALREGVEPAAWQERTLNDGSTHRVFKRHLDPAELAGEIGGEVLLAGRWFVAARAWR